MQTFTALKERCAARYVENEVHKLTNEMLSFLVCNLEYKADIKASFPTTIKVRQKINDRKDLTSKEKLGVKNLLKDHHTYLQFSTRPAATARFCVDMYKVLQISTMDQLKDFLSSYLKKTALKNYEPYYRPTNFLGKKSRYVLMLRTMLQQTQKKYKEFENKLSKLQNWETQQFQQNMRTTIAVQILSDDRSSDYRQGKVIDAQILNDGLKQPINILYQNLDLAEQKIELKTESYKRHMTMQEISSAVECDNQNQEYSSAWNNNYNDALVNDTRIVESNRDWVNNQKSTYKKDFKKTHQSTVVTRDTLFITTLKNEYKKLPYLKFAFELCANDKTRGQTNKKIRRTVAKTDILPIFKDEIAIEIKQEQLKERTELENEIMELEKQIDITTNLTKEYKEEIRTLTSNIEQKNLPRNNTSTRMQNTDDDDKRPSAPIDTGFFKQNQPIFSENTISGKDDTCNGNNMTLYQCP